MNSSKTLNSNQGKLAEDINASITTRLNETSQQQDKRFIKVENSVENIKANLISLMGKVDEMPNETQLKELIATAINIGESKSSFFAQAKLTSKSDELPHGWAGVSKYLGIDVPKEDVEQGTNDAKNIKALFTRSIATNSAHWQNVDNKLIVKYADGSITYTPKVGLSSEELDKLVIELNNLQTKTWIQHPEQHTE